MKKDPYEKDKPTTHFHPRRLARKVAKKNMEKKELVRINRNFASRWRSYVYE